MGIFTEYLERQLDFQAVGAERKSQLRRIAELRGHRDILVYASDLTFPDYRIQIDYSDVMPFSDQLANLNGTKLDLILETPGGSGEVAEKLVGLLRSKYEEVCIIVPGQAMSAGTIMAMAGDDILMEPSSNLGPIDAQISWQGKQFSAHALLSGFERIKNEVAKTGSLNLAYVPMLQSLSPGELENAENAQKFSKDLVTRWLAEYKFRNWTSHSSTGEVVTPEERRGRAEQIAGELCNQGRWLTHGRGISISDLESMRLRITDYSGDAALADAIRRYFILLHMTFEAAVYKVFETPTSQIYRFARQFEPPSVHQNPSKSQYVVIEYSCSKCHTLYRLFASLGEPLPINSDTIPFPMSGQFSCPTCGQVEDLTQIRNEIESQSGKTIVESLDPGETR